ncbi:Dynactin subunit 1 (150 kDa dynein-associated polypeptide) (DAP-150) (DP-150) (p150-glued) [Durusdinium trenchii]|uniref:Dynactin subunit 1 (150 kDa dynein-associated polypeptide) (DAP-150) (DP-150) (p150-glued) n=1 Tax=Durusdinium trenchii TaxID=1381693 RepID=A0ABP0I529_9DINO
MTEAKVGCRVEVANKGAGVVRFVGETEFAPGIKWFGVELDQANGKNDGSVAGKAYFSCEANHGCFVKEDAVLVLQPPEEQVKGGSSEQNEAVAGQQQRVKTPARAPPPPPEAAETPSTPAPAAKAAAAGQPGQKASGGPDSALSKVQAARERKRALAERLERRTAATKSASAAMPGSTRSPASTPATKPQRTASISATQTSPAPTALAADDVRLAELSAQVEEKDNALSALEATVESIKGQLVSKEEEIESLRATAESEKQARIDLESQLRTLTSQAERADMDAEAKGKAAVAKLQRQVEKQASELEELQGVVETLSLDKEQMEVDKDIAEEKADGLDSQLQQLQLDFDEVSQQLEDALEAAGAAAGDAAAAAAAIPQDVSKLSEENGKLREALKRLHAASTSEKSEFTKQVKALTKERDALAAAQQQLDKLKPQHQQLEQQVEELKSMLDTAQAYETMVETLSEKNLELADANADLREANEELEELRLLSEEVEQQHLDLQRDLERDLEGRNTELVNAQIQIESLEQQLKSNDQSMDKVKAVILDAQERDREAQDLAAQLTTAQEQLAQAKAKARDANLALLNETENKLARTIAMETARTAREQLEVQVRCVQALVPPSTLAPGKAVLQLIQATLELLDSASLLVQLILRSGAANITKWDPEKAPVFTLDVAAACVEARLDAKSVWAVLRAPKLSWDACCRLANAVGPMASQNARVVAQLLEIVQRGDLGVRNLAEARNTVDTLLETLAASSVTLRASISKVQQQQQEEGLNVGDVAMPPLGIEQLRRVQLVLFQRAGEFPEQESVLYDLDSCCKTLEQLEKDAPGKLVEFAREETELVEVLQSLPTSTGPALLPGASLVRQLLLGERSVTVLLPLDVPAWDDFARLVLEDLESASSTREELQDSRSALKRRVLELHEKTSELTALHGVRDDLQQKLDASREIALERDGLVAKCKQLEEDLANKTREYDQAVQVARDEAEKHETEMSRVMAAASANPRQVGPNAEVSPLASLLSPGKAPPRQQPSATEPSPSPSKQGGPRLAASAPADPLAERLLRDEVEFWKARGVVNRMSELKALRFQPVRKYDGKVLPLPAETRFAGGEDTLDLTRARALMAQALVAQSTVRVPRLSSNSSASLHQQVLSQQVAARALSRSLGDPSAARKSRQLQVYPDMSKVASVQVPGSSSAACSGAAPLRRKLLVDRSTMDVLFKPLPVLQRV